MNAIRTLRHFSPAIGMGFALFVVLSATSVCVFFFFLYFGMFLVDIFASCANTQTASRSDWGEITKETRYPFFHVNGVWFPCFDDRNRNENATIGRNRHSEYNESA